MKERPILFNGEMVRAILRGDKTQTRRVVKPQPPEHHEDPAKHRGRWYTTDNRPPHILDSYELACPHGVPGDRLWVRETWRVEREVDHMRPSDLPNYGHYAVDYLADGLAPEWAGKTRPSIYMPRWASRIMLEVVGVRVERLQDITEDDARAEGVEPIPVHGEQAGRREDGGHWSALPAFAELWDIINAKRGFSWESNPWVWVVEFSQEEAV